MPLYEGIGVVGDKHAVVFDIGTAYTKCGFAGEDGPRCIIPSTVLDWKRNVTHRVVDYEQTVDVQRDRLIEFLQLLYRKHLLVNPKDRRVVVVENVLCPTLYRELIGEVFFKHFEVPTLLFVPSVLAACFPLGTQNVLVVDVGFEETVVMPVFEGIPLLNCCSAAPLGSKYIHECLKGLLLGCSVSTPVGPMPVAECSEILSESVVEDIKVRTCFVTHLDRGHKIQAVRLNPELENELPTPPPDVEYPLEGNKILRLSGKIREEAFENFFEHDVDGKCFPNLILDSILRCPIDLRRPMAASILVIGGSTMMPGFMARVKAELAHCLATDFYGAKLPELVVKFFQPPCKKNYAAWLGGAVFGALEILPHRSLARDSYLANPNIPDWTTFKGTAGEDEVASTPATHR